MLSTIEKILFLKQMEFFQDFTARELGLLAQKVVEKGFSKGEIVFRQGDPCDAIYFIVGGKVRIIKEGGGLRETVGFLEERSFFGEMGILGDEVRTATVEAADTLTLLRIDKDEFRNIILKKPEIVFPIFKILIERINKANDMYLKAMEGK